MKIIETSLVLDERNPSVLFFWHSGGGAHRIFVVKDDSEFCGIKERGGVTSFPYFKIRNFDFDIKEEKSSFGFYIERKIFKRIEIFVQTNFLQNFLPCYIDEGKGIIFVHSHNIGKIIGAGGRVIRQLNQYGITEVKEFPDLVWGREASNGDYYFFQDQFDALEKKRRFVVLHNEMIAF